MFPLDDKILQNDIKIHYTMRIMPEDQNTGGFYVALLKKNDHVRFNKNEQKTEESGDEKVMQKVKLNEGGASEVVQGEEKIEETKLVEKPVKHKKGGYRIPKMDYLPFSDKYPDAWAAIRDLYGFDEVILVNSVYQRKSLRQFRRPQQSIFGK